MGFGFDLMESVFPSLFILAFITIFGFMLVTMFRNLREWNQNNHSPRLTVDAAVVAKRTNVSRSTHTDANNFTHHAASTTYYATFQVESGDRLELRVSGPEYGMIAEGDTGRLSFQGTRFLGFERTGGALWK